MISRGDSRCPAALAAKKASGSKLGNPRNIALAGSRGRDVQTAAADHFAADLLPIIQAIRAEGATTLDAMTRALNLRGIRTVRGPRWHVSSLSNLLARTKKIAEPRSSEAAS